MTDLVTRSGRCHGPGCERVISMWGRSADFCDEECQMRWHAKWGAGMLVDERPQMVEMWLAAAGVRLEAWQRDVVDWVYRSGDLSRRRYEPSIRLELNTEPILPPRIDPTFTATSGEWGRRGSEPSPYLGEAPAQPATEDPPKRRWWWSR